MQGISLPNCEICGRTMKGRGRAVKIDQATLLACPQCSAGLGAKSTPNERSRDTERVPSRPAWTSRSRTSEASDVKPQIPPVRKKAPKRKSIAPVLDDMILVEGFAKIIRKARQKKGISQDELAQRVGERISTLQAIEAGRLKPVGKTTRGLERELEISLLEPIGSTPIKASKSGDYRGTTLGDVVKVKRKKRQKSD